MNKAGGPRELFEQVQQRGWCIGCGACVELCPYFVNFRGKTSRLFDCSLAHGRCFAYCPKIEVDLDAIARAVAGRPYDGSPLGHFRETLAARAAGDLFRGRRFQGGGSATAVVAFALKENLVDAAALTVREGLAPAARLVTSWQAALECAGSKFTAAPTLSALNAAARSGYRRLAATGTPCQATAAAQMRLHAAAEEAQRVPIELSVGLFCSWALDARALTERLTPEVDPKRIRFMEIPPPPAEAMTFETDDGPLSVPLADVRRLIPPSCFICLDLTAEFADISIGMFEGRPGWNTLIVRTRRGEEIVARARTAGFLETAPFPPENLEHLRQAAAAKKARAARMLARSTALNTSGGLAAVRMPPEVAERLLAGGRTE